METRGQEYTIGNFVIKFTRIKNAFLINAENFSTMKVYRTQISDESAVNISEKVFPDSKALYEAIIDCLGAQNSEKASITLHENGSMIYSTEYWVGKLKKILKIKINLEEVNQDPVSQMQAHFRTLSKTVQDLKLNIDTVARTRENFEEMVMRKFAEIEMRLHALENKEEYPSNPESKQEVKVIPKRFEYFFNHLCNTDKFYFFNSNRSIIRKFDGWAANILENPLPRTPIEVNFKIDKKSSKNDEIDFMIGVVYGCENRQIPYYSINSYMMSDEPKLYGSAHSWTKTELFISQGDIIKLYVDLILGNITFFINEEEYARGSLKVDHVDIDNFYACVHINSKDTQITIIEK